MTLSNMVNEVAAAIIEVSRVMSWAVLSAFPAILFVFVATITGFMLVESFLQ